MLLTPLRLAWRNTWRQRRRTLLLIIVVAYATISTLFYWSFVDGYMASVVNAYARFIAEPVQVTTPAWFKDPDPENALPSLDIMGDLLRQPQVKAAAPRLDFAGLIRSSYTSEGVEVRGVDPEAEQKVSALPKKISQGHWLEAPGEAVLGYKVAERLDVRIGERFVLDAQALAGSQGQGLTLVGLIDAGVAAIDQNSVLITLEDARNLTGVTTATSIALEVPRGREASVAKQLGTKLPTGVNAYGVWELIGPIKTDVVGAKISAIPIGLLMALFAAMAVTSTVLVSVMERTREFGVIEALGLLPRILAQMITFESIIATTLGYIVGLILGYLIIWILATHNLIGPLFAAFGEAWTSTGLTEEFYAVVKPIYTLYALATVILAGLFSVLVPARRALQLQPTEAMRAN